MTNLQRLVLVLAFIFALLVGVLLATTVLNGGPSSTPVPSSSGQAQVSPSTSPGASVQPSASDGSVAPSTEPSVAPSESATPSDSASPSPSTSPSPSPSPAPKATVTVTQLKLDAAADAGGADRVISWAANGTGAVTVQLTTTSTDGATSKMCLTGAGKALGCRSGASGKLSATTSGTNTKFSLTVRGVASGTPIVSVKIVYPAIHGSITITNARFDGTSNPDYNGIQVVVQPRVNGNVKIVADWGGHPLKYEIDLIEQGGGAGLQTLPNQGPATNVTTSLPVTKPNGWMVVLQNIEVGFGVTPLTATISWP